MSIPPSLTYTQRNKKLITFGPVTAATTPFAPIVGSTVRATLYLGRIAGTGGTPVPQITDLSLADIGSGLYQGEMADDTFAPPVGLDYTTVIDLTGPGSNEGHWEIPSQVTLRSTN